jgi:hypothetical protein
MIDIMYSRLLYASVLPLKTLVLYIYRPRGIMRYNQQLYSIYSFLHGNQSLVFLSSNSSPAFDRVAPGEADLDSIEDNAPGSPRVLLIWRLLSLSRRHALVDWKFSLVSGEDSPSSTNNAQNTSM